jgi:hypothetical protein
VVEPRVCGRAAGCGKRLPSVGGWLSGCVECAKSAVPAHQPPVLCVCCVLVCAGEAPHDILRRINGGHLPWTVMEETAQQQQTGQAAAAAAGSGSAGASSSAAAAAAAAAGGGGGGKKASRKQRSKVSSLLPLCLLLVVTPATHPFTRPLAHPLTHPRTLTGHPHCSQHVPRAD